MVKEGMTDRELDRDEIGSFVGVTWNRQASDRDEWRRLEEAFVLLWTHRG